MQVFSILMSISLLFCACTKEQTGASVSPPSGRSGIEKTWLALGDSYTIGQSVPVTERFPDQTATLLRARGVNMPVPDYIATTGWTTTDLQNAINARNPAPHDVVSLLIGVNDQYQTHDTTGYRQRFTALLEKSIQLARNKKENVFVLSIPDYSVTPFAAGLDRARIRQEIDWFNAINLSVTQSYGISYLDITPSTREAETDATLVAFDGLHPSGLEYKKWAERLVPLMLAALR